jgi:hypothetical protein
MIPVPSFRIDVTRKGLVLRRAFPVSPDTLSEWHAGAIILRASLQAQGLSYSEASSLVSEAW